MFNFFGLNLPPSKKRNGMGISKNVRKTVKCFLLNFVYGSFSLGLARCGITLLNDEKSLFVPIRHIMAWQYDLFMFFNPKKLNSLETLVLLDLV